MDKFKNFLKSKKVNKHFKHTGPGQRLCESSSGSPSIVSGSAQGGEIDRVASADVAAQAALKRLYKNEPQQTQSYSQKKIQMMAKQELEEERRKAEAVQSEMSKQREPERKTFEHSNALQTVCFTCELIGESIVLTKPELMDVVGNFLEDQVDGVSEESVISSVLMIYSLNNSSTREVAVETLGKYLQNIIEHPEEEKYRKIRLSNKAFQERVQPVKGAKQFLSSVGFQEVNMSPKDNETPEAYLVLPAVTDDDVGRLVESLESLRNGQSVPIKLARNCEVFRLKGNQQVTAPRVSADFYNVTSAEVKKEQDAKTEEVDKLLTLRTKEMRLNDSKLREYKYKYTLIRIRLPEQLLIQATFSSHEKFSAVRNFLLECFSDDMAAYTWAIRDPTSPNKEIDEESSLTELGLVPAAVLMVKWDTPVTTICLSPDLIENAKEFVC